MSHGKFSEYSCKLNYLQLSGPFTETATYPSCFLSKLPNIISLAVHNGFLKELFLFEGLDCKEEHSELHTKLSFLDLKNLFDSYLWEEYSDFSKVFLTLATLKVIQCPNLRTLVTFTVSFRNLTTLLVSNCGKLLNLMTHSTAKSLEQLTKMEITECNKIKEIVTHKEDEGEVRIIFNQLKYLRLNHLPRLAIFYSGSCTIEFPSLQQVVVKQCPNMKIFSRGELNTPRLNTLQMTETENGGCWEGDLNTTIQQQNIEKCSQEEEDETEYEEDDERDEMEYVDEEETTDNEEDEDEDVDEEETTDNEEDEEDKDEET